MYLHTENPLAYGSPAVKAKFKQSPEDFKVNEKLGFKPVGFGQHLYLFIQKTGLNTRDVIKHLADKTGSRKHDIGYSGLKDKISVSSQWFSLDLKGKDLPDINSLAANGIKVLQYEKHNKKLKVGSHMANEFVIRLRELAGDEEKLKRKLENIKQHGVPNYFGAQRFGRENSNLKKALEFVENDSARNKGYLYSVLRAYLFNRVLAQRVGQNSWNKLLEGDVVKFDDSNSCFVADDINSLKPRLATFDLHPTGPLWGRDGMRPRLGARKIEDMALKDFAKMLIFLEQRKLKMARRALRLKVKNFTWSRIENELELKFTLVKGGFATAVLKELCEI